VPAANAAFAIANRILEEDQVDQVDQEDQKEGH
jgi:hypothetical protein